jgi:hypothetical protein
VALSPDTGYVMREYYPLFPENLFEVDDLPAFSSSEDVCVVVTDSGVIIDSLAYLDDWHFPDLDNVEGVSLERHDFDRPTQDPDNWHSAATTVRYATPGYVNSQIQTGSEQTEVWLEPATFSPDLDNRDDVLFINYRFESSGWNARVTIFDHKGRQVIRLQENILLATESGTFTWDGINTLGARCDVGVYVVLFEATNPNGEKRAYKHGVVLAGKI